MSALIALAGVSRPGRLDIISLFVIHAAGSRSIPADDPSNERDALAGVSRPGRLDIIILKYSMNNSQVLRSF